MRITARKIDSNGFLIFGEDTYFEEYPSNEELAGYVTTPLPTDENGNQLPFYRPRWFNGEWVEDCTQEEIDEMLKPKLAPPTEVEVLTSYVLDVDMRLVMVEMGLT